MPTVTEKAQKIIALVDRLHHKGTSQQEILDGITSVVFSENEAEIQFEGSALEGLEKIETLQNNLQTLTENLNDSPLSDDERGACLRLITIIKEIVGNVEKIEKKREQRLLSSLFPCAPSIQRWFPEIRYTGAESAESCWIPTLEDSYEYLKEQCASNGVKFSTARWRWSPEQDEWEPESSSHETENVGGPQTK